MTDKITRINPMPSPMDGVIRVPGDKSISHRAVLFSAMAEGTSRISGVLDSEDVRSSIGAVRALGAEVNLEKMPDGSLEGGITGWGAKGPSQPDGPIDCGNSGTTTRLLMGVVAPWNIRVTLTGDASLQKRPMRRIALPLTKMGASFEPVGQDTLPITVVGNTNIHTLDYEMPVSSAQLKTAIMLAGLRANGTTSVTEPAPSRNHTELMLPEYGAKTTASAGFASVEGPVTLKASEVVVPGDPSSSAFLICAALLQKGATVQVENVSLNVGRIGYARTLEKMGADINIITKGHCGKEPYGTISASFTPDMHGCEIPADKIASLVDEVPVLALVAAFCKGVTVFRGCGELRVKESDRLQAIIDGLDKLGIEAWAEDDDLFIKGNPDQVIPEGLVFDSLNDHRLAMTWSLVGLCKGTPVDIINFESVAVSFPGFLDQFEKLV